MREATPRLVGVLDSDGVIIASTNLSLIGQPLGSAVPSGEAGTVECADGRTFKTLEAGISSPGYIVFAEGEDEHAKAICILASIAVAEAKTHYEENNDRSAFIKSILSDNVLPGDIYVRSRDLGFMSDAPRAVFLIRQSGQADTAAVAVIRDMFPDTQNDFVVFVSASDIVLVAQMPNSDDSEKLLSTATALEKRLQEAGISDFVIGIGTAAKSLRELADRYKEAQVAIDVVRVFDNEQTVIFYENLGIGRLIYQLPTKLCEMFLSEVFKKNPIEALDTETLFTINKFFENNLNVSETSRKLFVHRNTLVYRLEKIKKITGLDLRELDHAIVFKVALMVKKYLNSQIAPQN
jgi:carbohydrate diacid regulator